MTVAGGNEAVETLVDPIRLAGLAEEVDRIGAGIEAVLGRLEASVADVSGIWSGQAYDAFVAAQQSWAGSAEEVRQTLDALAAAVREVSEAHAAYDHTAASRFE